MQLPSANIARSPMRLCAIAARTAVQLRILSLPRLDAQSMFLRFSTGQRSNFDLEGVGQRGFS